MFLEFFSELLTFIFLHNLILLSFHSSNKYLFILSQTSYFRDNERANALETDIWTYTYSINLLSVLKQAA